MKKERLTREDWRDPKSTMWEKVDELNIPYQAKQGMKDVLRKLAEYEDGEIKTQRMYDHMKNTLRDIKNIIGKNDISDDEKLKGVELNIHLLESVECGEVITSK